MFKRMHDYFQFEIVAWHFNVTSSSVSIFDKDKVRKLGYDMLYLAAICRNRLVEMVEVVYSLKKIENLIFNQVRRTKVMTRALEMIPLAPSSSGMHVPRAIFVDLEPTDIDEVGNRRADIRNSENEIHVLIRHIVACWFVSPTVGILTWPTICGCVKSQEQERVERCLASMSLLDLYEV
ncbi:hypothetical protein Tco_0455608 [Tanacetum coccineum]